MNLKKIFVILISSSYLIFLSYAHLTSSISIPGLKQSKNSNIRLLDIENIVDWLWATVYVLTFYFAKYAILGQILENTNPIPKTEYRLKMMKKQQVMGYSALFFVVICVTLFMWKGEQYLPYYGYWDTHQYTLYHLFMNVIIYMFVFDTYFWVSHIVMHIPWCMKYIHKYHHEFVEPTAFGQDAVHPFEAILQGPIGHYFCALFYPMHPITHSVIGLLTSIWALCAHDGRFDPNNHMYHHYYGDCNYGLYWGFWDIIFGKRYSKQRFPIEYVPTYLRKEDGNKKAD